MRIYISTKPSAVRRTCQTCGVSFFVHPYEVRLGHGRFCSRACIAPPRRIPAEQRFWRKVRKTDGCWPWLGGKTPDGYGTFHVSRERCDYAHRFSWELHNGQQIPDGFWCLHTCDTPACVNPAHLLLGDHVENMRQMAERGRSGPHNHPERMPRGEANATAKLTTEQVREIRRRRAQGETICALAAAFGVVHNHISRVASRKVWAHID